MTDLLTFAPEDDAVALLPKWFVLIADDDEDVHQTTALALRHVEILGRSLVLDHVRSGAEVIERLRQVGDEYYAVILLDVVMETSDAGLTTVAALRNELGIAVTRIVLRTGQPGHAPDIEAISNFEIDDYRTKSELTRNRLVTTLTSAIRTFRQLTMLQRSRRGLETIVRSASHLVEMRGLRAFAEGTLLQLTTLMELPLEGMVCAESERSRTSDVGELLVIGAAGRFASLINKPLATLPSDTVRDAILLATERKAHCFESNHTVLYLGSERVHRAIYLATSRTLTPLDIELVSVFATNISVGFRNASLFSDLDFAANYDALTHLPNRAHFSSLLREAFADDGDVSVALIDLRDFSSVAQGLGFDVASSLLRRVAGRLATRCATEGCLVGRMQSDVFAVGGPSGLVSAADLAELFVEPFTVDCHTVHVEVAIGIERSVNLGENVLMHAEIALDTAKSRQPQWAEYTADMGDRLQQDLALIRGLRSGFENANFEVWFQPQVDLTTSTPTGAEALLRWRVPGGGFVSPARFIPLAERTGLIRALGTWALRRALTEFAAVPGAPRLSVNVSPSELRDGAFLSRVMEALAATHFPPSRLTLEITESSFVRRDAGVMEVFEALRNEGIRLAVDDFGTGHASFEYLRWLRVDEVKIDKSFVDEIEKPHGAAICATIIELARRLDIEVVAEGIERSEQAERLRALGCRLVQGYRYAKPMPQADLLTWWSDHVG